jgi:hypothetical protein
MARFRFRDQNLTPCMALQPSLQATTGGQWAKPQHLQGLRAGEELKLQLPVVQSSWQIDG